MKVGCLAIRKLHRAQIVVMGSDAMQAGYLTERAEKNIALTILQPSIIRTVVVKP